MRILFDQGTPVPLRRVLDAHRVETAYEQHWSTLDNGDLLAAAEENGFDILVTTDLNLRYQQNLAGRKIAIVALSTPSWPRIRNATEIVVAAVEQASHGSYCEVSIP